MEPMAVSPGKSPNGGGLTPCSPSMSISAGGVIMSGGQYLPSFLMGELASPLSNGGATSSPAAPTSNYTRGSQSKVEGPPIVGLFDEMTASSPPLSPGNMSHLAQPNTPLSHYNSNSYLDTSCLENQENKSYWVVVYGFPPAQVSHIIAMFSQLGRLVEHSYPVNSNWVCLCYGNQTDMRKALSMNTKVLSNNLMIGVTERKQQFVGSPCEVDNGGACYAKVCQSHHQENKENAMSMSSSSPFPYNSSLEPYPDQVGCDAGGAVSGGMGTPVKAANLSSNISISSPTSPKIRPLALSRRQNAQSAVNVGPVPTADTSLVGKFMDFIFSW